GLPLLLAVASLVRCGEAPTEPRMPSPAPPPTSARSTTPTPAPTPTPVSVAHLAGKWEGTFSDRAATTAVKVSLIQTGYGYLTMPRGLSLGWSELYVTGLSGGYVSVVLTYADQGIARLTGAASATEINVTGHRYSDTSRSMSLHLTRPL